MSVLTPQQQHTEGSATSQYGALPIIRKVHSNQNNDGSAAAAAVVGDSWDLHENSQQPTQTATARLTLLSMPTPTQPTQPCRLEAKIPLSATSLPPSLLADSTGAHKAVRRVALSDFIARRLQAAVSRSPAARFFGIRTGPIGSFCLETDWVCVCPADEGNGEFNILIIFEIFAATAGAWTLNQNEFGGGGEDSCGGYHNRLFGGVMSLLKNALVTCEKLGDGERLNVDEARVHVESIQDQRHLRNLVASSDGIAFVADGAILPRKGGADDAPMDVSQGAVPFQSPPSLRHEFTLPHHGVVSGMLLPRGVTVIVGGGYHGKSTLLRALAVGVYDKVPGDGREFAVTDPGAVTIRAEDGRPVSGVDISPFISALPSSGVVKSAAASITASPAQENFDCSKAGEQNSTECFSTGGASGSTSQAANVMEALEAGATALLLDEDTCAGNFMIRDSRMRAMVSHEPITPFIYRVSHLWLDLGVSSVIVIGGCGDYFDVHDTAILVDNYVATDATERAHSISRRFCVGRVQYAGRGLVHRLPWPGNPSPRAIVPESVMTRTMAAKNVAAKRRAVQQQTYAQNGDNGASENAPKRECGVDASSANEPGPSSAYGAASVGDMAVFEQKPSPVRNRAVGVAGISNGVEGAVEMGSEVSGHVNRDDHEEGWKSVEVLTPPRGQQRCSCTCYCGAASHASSGGGKIARIGNVSADLTRVEQIVGGAAQTRGCALGVEWVIRETQRLPGLPISKALDALDASLRAGEGDGLAPLAGMMTSKNTRERRKGSSGISEGVSYGPIAKPRRFEVAAALHRLPVVRFESASVGVNDGERLNDV